MKNLSIAMCQIFCLDGDRSGNFARIENAIGEAANAGADIICFPETAILGWVNPAAHERAFEIPGEDSNRLAELAKKYKKPKRSKNQSDNRYELYVNILRQWKWNVSHIDIENALNDLYPEGLEQLVRFGGLLNDNQ